MTPRERQWRRRNPDLAARFDRLPKAAQANIRTTNWQRGTAGIVRQADVVRREKVATRSRKRRSIARARTYANLPKNWRIAERPVTENDEFWDEYDRIHGG